MRRVLWSFAGALLALAACSPALDWREVRPDDSGAVAWFPCKPTHHARRVSLAGQERLLHLVACSAGDATWALAFADVGDPAQVGAALDALRSATLDNLGADAGAVRTLPLAVAGATPFAASGRLAFAGRRPDGLAVQAQVAVFARGTRAFQATVIGARLPTDGLAAFFDGLATPG
jgi:hypothetical protein